MKHIKNTHKNGDLSSLNHFNAQYGYLYESDLFIYTRIQIV